MKKNNFEKVERTVPIDVSLSDLRVALRHLFQELPVNLSKTRLLPAIESRLLPIFWLLILAIRDLARNPEHSMADSFVISALKDENVIRISLIGKKGEFYNCFSSGAIIELGNGSMLKAASAKTVLKELTEIYEMIADDDSILGRVVETPSGPLLKLTANEM